MPKRDAFQEDQPLWYKDAIVYQLHVKAFCDANHDGIGDFKGLTQKLDYLESLGVTVLWILPFYPSPFRDDGYDISDYYNVHPDYGSMRDFRRFLQEAHRRGIRVITELVVNHTSDQHPWFQRARRAKPGSTYWNFYVWSQTPDRYKDTRIIFKDFEKSNWTLDPTTNMYYWHRFYSHQPDLNYDSAHVQKAVLRTMEYWFELGVDGLRLDAVPYLFEREGTNCENLPETHDFLKKLRSHIDRNFKNRMVLAEANQWPEDAVAYFGKGDECHMAFHFPLMPRMFMAIQMEDRFPLVDILEQTPAIPDNCQWAIFLRNHDELTLEMVTDEERDYMYRVYARDPKARINLGIRRRLAPLMENDRRKIELMNVLLFSLPGTPIVYYGDEIGMGDNHYLGDRNGVRTPMQWSADRNAGFSRANPQMLYLPIIIDPEYHYEALNVENQERNSSSLLWWMRRMIGIRKQLKALSMGSLHFLFPDNPKVLAFVRKHQDEKVLVVVNLSRHPQLAEIDLSSCATCVPEEVFSRNRFPEIKESTYPLTLGAYGYYLFYLREKPESVTVGAEEVLPELGAVEHWEGVARGRVKLRLEREVLPGYIKQRRWFAGKARRVQSMKIVETIPVGRAAAPTLLLAVEVQYTEGPPEVYQLPLSFASGEEGERIGREHPLAVIARLKAGAADGIVYDGVYDPGFRQSLLGMIARRGHASGTSGRLLAYPARNLRRLLGPKGLPTEDSQVLKAEQTNTAVLYENRLFFKLYRRLEEGLNPDMEISRFLTERRSFAHIPAFAGAIEYDRPGAGPACAGLLQVFVPNQGDAWRYTVDEVGRYLERVLSRKGDLPSDLQAPSAPLALAYQEVPLVLQELVGGLYLEMASLLGKRTAQMHLALASDPEDPDFAPQPFSLLYQRSLYQSLQSYARKVFQLLRKNIKALPEDVRRQAEPILAKENEILGRYRALLDRKINAMTCRIHGDYHLGQVLYTGNDFIIIDFEGEPARPLGERRLKRSPIQDVAGMLRSFHYAAYAGLMHHVALRPEDKSVLDPWADLWQRHMGGIFLRSYLDTVGEAPFLPGDPKELEILLHAFLLNKSIYEMGYELNARPDWVMISVKGIQSVLGIHESASLLVEIQKAYPLGLPSP